MDTRPSLGNASDEVRRCLIIEVLPNLMAFGPGPIRKL
jgi:hypothetical protein